MQSAGRERILIFATDDSECAAMALQLSRAGIESSRCTNMKEFCGRLHEGCLAAILTQEAAEAAPQNGLSDCLDLLASVLSGQSDNWRPSLLFVTRDGDVTKAARFGAPLLVPRPVPAVTLISWARSALCTAAHELRSRERLNEQSLAVKRAREELAARKADLRRLSVDLEQFIFSASHELREPLRTLALYSQKLRRRSAQILDEDTRESLAVVLSSAERMEALFRDLLAYIQVESIAPAGAQVDGNAVLENVLAKLQGVIQKSGAAVQADTLPPLAMAEPHLSKILEHLIENAIKYRTPGVNAEIRISAYERDGKSIVCVRDNGVGIAPQHQERVFGLFRRLHSPAEYEGTGLGLAICKKIADQYGGRIWVESDVGKGAVFCFEVPRHAAPPQGRSSAASA